MSGASNAAIFPFAAVLCCLSTLAVADALDKQVLALAAIRDAADSICYKVSQSGSAQSDEVKAKISSTVLEVIGFGVSTATERTSSIYEGVLQKDLGNV